LKAKFTDFLKIYIRKIKPLFVIIKIVTDRRYFYHYAQGFFYQTRTRRALGKIESTFFKSDRKYSDKTQEVIAKSYIENPIYISPEDASDIRDSLEAYKCHDIQSNSSIDFHIKSKPDGCSLAYYHTADMYKNKKILEIATNQELISIFNNLYDCDPIIDYIGAWWTFPSKVLHGTQLWHRDMDTLNQLKFFVYLTDVGYDTGPHSLIPGSHDIEFRTKKDQKHNDDEMSLLIDRYGKKDFLGPSGTNFLENNFAFHRGNTVRNEPRLLLEVIYSRIQTPFSSKKPFIKLDELEHRNIITENINLFKGKVLN